jgi:hypothetical protein
MNVIALYNSDVDTKKDAAPGSIASWHSLAIAIRIGYFDLLAAARVVSDPGVANKVREMGEKIRDTADALDQFITYCWGYEPSIDRGPAGTCQTIMKRLQSRFGDAAVMMEAENYHRSVLDQLDRLTRAVESRFRSQLLRHREVVAGVASELHSLSVGRERPARSVAS